MNPNKHNIKIPVITILKSSLRYIYSTKKSAIAPEIIDINNTKNKIYSHFLELSLYQLTHLYY